MGNSLGRACPAPGMYLVLTKCKWLVWIIWSKPWHTLHRKRLELIIQVNTSVPPSTSYLKGLAFCHWANVAWPSRARWKMRQVAIGSRLEILWFGVANLGSSCMALGKHRYPWPYSQTYKLRAPHYWDPLERGSWWSAKLSATGKDCKRQRRGENDRLGLLQYFHVSSQHSCPRTYLRYDRPGVESKFFHISKLWHWHISSGCYW